MLSSLKSSGWLFRCGSGYEECGAVVFRDGMCTYSVTSVLTTWVCVTLTVEGACVWVMVL